MAELNDVQKATLRAHAGTYMLECYTAMRANPNFDIKECLIKTKNDHQTRVSEERPYNGQYVNLARDYLSEVYEPYINPPQSAGKLRKRSKHTRKRHIRKTARYTRKGR